MDGIKNIQLKLSHVSSDSDSYVRGKIVKYCKIGTNRKKKLYISLPWYSFLKLHCVNLLYTFCTLHTSACQ